MKLLFYSIIVVFFIGCSNSSTQSYSNLPAACSLPDSLFVFKNISNSLIAEKFYYDLDNSAYTDTSKRIKLFQLNTSQKKQLFDSDWIVSDWQVYFVSKQSKIESFTPIIVSAGGTDYSALILILLDSTCHPLSNFILSGGECGIDPKECDFKQSYLNGRQIKSYIRTIVDRENLYESDSILVDSVNYNTEILPNGTFRSKQIDSIRYIRKSFL